MSKMGLHDPFGHLKHKLWPKEGSGVKLAIWLPTTKSQEPPRFPCVQVTNDILLKSSQWGKQLCFKPHLNRRSTHKVMGPQSHESLNFGNFKTPTWESQDKMSFGCGPHGEAQKYNIRRKVVSPKSGLWWVLWVWVCPLLVLAPKVLQHCTNQLIIWFCAGPCEWLSACQSS